MRGKKGGSKEKPHVMNSPVKPPYDEILSGVGERGKKDYCHVPNLAVYLRKGKGEGMQKGS